MINGFDSVITHSYKGDRFRVDFVKDIVAGITATRPTFLGTMTGTSTITPPVKGGGTNKSFVTLTEDEGIPHGGNVSPARKHIANCTQYSNNIIGHTMMLADIAGYYPGIDPNSTTTFTMSGSVPQRYSQGWLLGLYYTDVVSGMTGASTLTVNYTNQGGVAGRSVVVTGANATSGLYYSYQNQLFTQMQAGDIGIQSIQSIQINTAHGGNGTITAFLFRPLITVPVYATFTASERDYVNQNTFMPIVPDNASLHQFAITSATAAANSAFSGSIEFLWG